MLLVIAGQIELFNGDILIRELLLSRNLLEKNEEEESVDDKAR